VDELAWVKRTVNGKIAKGHGFYLQHAKESCLVGVKVIKIFYIMKG
jgi:mRNA (2'-O-methyladenosine-N6-)-methyltransferase